MFVSHTILVVALPAEARTINRHFGLVRDTRAKEFPLYRGRALAAVVSGVGQQAAERATRWLGGQSTAQKTNWINVGIAGHSERTIGETLLASEIIDIANQQRWRTQWEPTSSNKMWS